jgi:uroporphyrinogen decarboxylase
MMMNKRDLVLSLLDRNKKPRGIPAAFFMHFDEIYHRGQAAVDKHLEYFRYTGMDFVKIQFEHNFPFKPERPDDWVHMPLYKKDFYKDDLEVVDGLVKRAKKESLVMMTLYSPYMCARFASKEKITEHIKENPEKAKKGMEIITESLMIFVKECIHLGIDGFYHSTQGGESHKFGGSTLFKECIKPYDLILMEEINKSCLFNILHICDIHGLYNDLTPYLDYPGHIVNCGLQLESRKLTGKEVSNMFNRPYMGGIERKGKILSGNKDEIERMVEEVLDNAPEKFILGADCTLPSDVNWDNMKIAISTAHEYKKKINQRRCGK